MKTILKCNSVLLTYISQSSWIIWGQVDQTDWNKLNIKRTELLLGNKKQLTVDNQDRRKVEEEKGIKIGLDSGVTAFVISRK